MLLLLLVCAAPAAGDWLVMRDGSRIETEGTWRVKGRQVVFTQRGGTLAALRLADVDLDASAEATAESHAPAGEAAGSKSGPRRPILVLTNDDLPSGSAGASGDEAAGEDAAEGEAGDEDAGGGDAGSESDAADAEAVVIVSWREQESSAVDGLELVGSVRNTSTDVAAGVRVQVRIPGEDGGMLETRAFLQRSSLAPGQTSTFRALLPGIYALEESPTFEVASESLTIGGAARPSESSDEEGPYDEEGPD
ncbi:MAG: hypothetical protein GY716_23160, partial [bacterium]|nr:hypothetical protein [bacterium]